MILHDRKKNGERLIRYLEIISDVILLYLLKILK